MVSMSLRQMTVFKAVVDCAGVNAAAHHIGISQPSVTAHIQAIERQIGTKLFFRMRGRKLRPTSAGEVLYSYTHETLTKAEALRTKLNRCAADGEQKLLLAVQRTIASTVLPAHLASFVRLYPDARISMHSETQEIVQDLVRRNQVDLGIFYALNVEAGMEILGRERLVFIASPKHPLATRRQIDVCELGSFPFVSGLPESQFYQLVRQSLASIGLLNYPAILHLQDSLLVKRAVAMNLGVACTLRSAVEDEVAAGSLAILSVSSEIPHLNVCCIRAAQSDVSALAQKFLDHFRSIRS